MPVTTQYQTYALGGGTFTLLVGNSAPDVATVGWENGGFFAVDTGGSNIYITDIANQSSPVIKAGSDGAIATLTNSRVVTTWTDPGGGIGFYIQTSGGGHFAGDIDAGQAESSSDVAALAGGGFVVVDHKQYTSTDYDIEVHIRTQSGAAVTDFAVDATSAEDVYPSVIGLADGGFAVGWDRVASDGSTSVWVAVYNANGSVRTAPAQIDPSVAFGGAGIINRDVSLTALKSGGFAVGYEDSGWAGTQTDITDAIFDKNGTFQRYVHADALPTDDNQAALATLSNGLVVTAFSNNSTSNNQVDFNVDASLIDPTTGAVLPLNGGTNGAIAASADIEGTPSVAAFASLSQFIVMWTDFTEGFVWGEVLQLSRISTGTSGADTIKGDDAVDIISGGGGADTLTGGGNSDGFYFYPADVTDAQSGVVDTIKDFDQGNSGSYDATEGDVINLQAILGAAYNQGNGQPIASLVRAVENGTHTGADLVIDPDGTANGENWVTVAHLDNLKIGQTVNVLIDYNSLGDPNIPVIARPASDFNGDLQSDLVFQNTDGTPAVWLMNGTGVTIFGNSLTNPGSNWHIIGTGDFDGDHKADLVWQNTDGTPAVWLMNGTSVGTFGPGLTDPGASWHVIGAGDFNNDGKADILWQNTDGTPAVWLMNGTGVTTYGNGLTNAGPAWHAVAAADFDGDGKADILFQNTDGTPAVWLMNGTNPTTKGPGLNDPGAAWHIITAADFDGDGKADVLWQNTDGTPAVWLMNGTGVTTYGNALPNPGTAWHIIGAADFNGDGKADIVWQNDDGTPAVWLMNGTTVDTFGPSLHDPGTSWHII